MKRGARANGEEKKLFNNRRESSSLFSYENVLLHFLIALRRSVKRREKL